MHMLRMQYETDKGIDERLYPLGADLRCMAYALDLLADGRAVVIEPVGNYQVMARFGGDEDGQGVRH